MTVTLTGLKTKFLDKAEGVDPKNVTGIQIREYSHRVSVMV